MTNPDLDQFINGILNDKAADSPLAQKLKVKATEIVNLEKRRAAKLEEIKQLNVAIHQGRGGVVTLGEMLYEEFKASKAKVPAPPARGGVKKKPTRKKKASKR